MNSWLFPAILFSFLMVVGSEAVSVGDLLNAPRWGGQVDAGKFSHLSGNATDLKKWGRA
jgi:hypothetical protein